RRSSLHVTAADALIRQLARAQTSNIAVSLAPAWCYLPPPWDLLCAGPGEGALAAGFPAAGIAPRGPGMITRAPSRRRSVPSTTTRSPTDRPDSTAAIGPAGGPVLIGRTDTVLSALMT